MEMRIYNENYSNVAISWRVRTVVRMMHFSSNRPMHSAVVTAEAIWEQ